MRAELGCLQQPHLRELREIRAGCLAGGVVLRAIGADIRSCLGVFQKMQDEVNGFPFYPLSRFSRKLADTAKGADEETPVRNAE